MICIESKRRTNSQCPNQWDLCTHLKRVEIFRNTLSEWKHLEPTLRKGKQGTHPKGRSPALGNISRNNVPTNKLQDGKIEIIQQ